MQLVASLVSVLLLVWSVRATALPGDERLAIQSTREQSTVRKDAILKMLAGLLDSVDVGREVAGPDVEEEGKLEEERAVLGRLAQLSPRDRKAMAPEHHRGGGDTTGTAAMAGAQSHGAGGRG